MTCAGWWRCDGDTAALEKLIPLVYDELHRLAHICMSREWDNSSLQTTALVHEAYLRLIGASQVDWQNRTHLFAVSASLMRRILSFGSVLYEIVTGRRAFQGDSQASTMASVLKEDPRPPSQLATHVPPGLERVIQRCLKKERERRWQHIDDVRVELKELLEDSGSQSASAGRQPFQRRRRWAWAASIGITLVVAGVWLWRLRTGTDFPPPEVVPLTSYAGEERSPTFSRDGRQVAFAWNGERRDNYDIYVKFVGETHALRLTFDPATDAYPVWSPDGRRIAFSRSGAVEKRGIYLVSPLGGPEQKLSDVPITAGLSRTPDGKWLAVPRPRSPGTTSEDLCGIYLIPVDGGAVRRITAPKAPLRDFYPAVSPDGRRIAFARFSSNVFSDVYCQQLKSDGSSPGQARRITRQDLMNEGLSWNPDGESIVFSASKLWGMRPYLWRVGADSGSPPVRLEGAGPYAADPAVAPSGNRLAYAYLKGLQDYDVWRCREGEDPEPVLTSSLVDMSAEFSPDGRKIAFASDRAGETFDIWLANADGSGPVQLGSAGLSPSLFGRTASSFLTKHVVLDLDQVLNVDLVPDVDGGNARMHWRRPDACPAPFVFVHVQVHV